MISKTSLHCLSVLASLILAHVAQAEIVNQYVDSGSSKTSLTAVPAVGQSFTANASVMNLQSIGFQWVDFNPGNSLPNLTMDLFQGSGFGGTLLDSDTKSISVVPIDFSFVPFDFSGNTLTPGADYTLRLTTNSGGRGAFVSGSDGNPSGVEYAGGHRYTTTITGTMANTTQDLGFQVLGTATVPEPSSLVMVGLSGFALMSRRRNKNAS